MRQWLFDVLSSNPDIFALTEGRVLQGESMLKAPDRLELPLLVYRMGNTTNEHLGHNSTAHRRFFQVYIHDRPADYSRIDTLCALVIAALDQSGAVPEHNILETSWLETSRDLDDEVFHTIVRYVRFQTVLST
jgi:hypothetical protein